MIKKTELITLFIDSICDEDDEDRQNALIKIFENKNYRSFSHDFFWDKYNMTKNTFKVKLMCFVIEKIKINCLRLHQLLPNIFKYDSTDRALFNSIVKDKFKPRNQNLKPLVIFIYGDAGTGKSRLCSNQMNQRNTFLTLSNLKWFNGYLQQPLCVFEDFRLSDFNNASLTYFLRLIDRYQMKVEIKQSHAEFNSPFILINTVFSKEQLMNKYNFSKQQNVSREEDEQLFRRIDVEIYLKKSQLPKIKIKNKNIKNCLIDQNDKILINDKNFEQLLEDWENGNWNF